MRYTVLSSVCFSSVQVSRDIVSPKTIRGMNKSIPLDGINRYRVSLKTKIRHKTQPVNAKHMQCQCIVSGRSCGPSTNVFDMYLLFCGPQFEKADLENLEQLLFLCIFWFWTLITASNYRFL